MSPRQRRNDTTSGALGNAGGGRVAIVFACLLVGTVLAGIARTMLCQHPHAEPLDDDALADIDALDDFWTAEDSMMRTLADEMEAAMPMRALNAGL